jgi:hypothetical protein
VLVRRVPAASGERAAAPQKLQRRATVDSAPQQPQCCLRCRFAVSAVESSILLSPLPPAPPPPPIPRRPADFTPPPRGACLLLTTAASCSRGKKMGGLPLLPAVGGAPGGQHRGGRFRNLTLCSPTSREITLSSQAFRNLIPRHTNSSIRGVLHSFS